MGRSQELVEPVGGGTEILCVLEVMEAPEVAKMAWEKPEIQALEEPLLAPSAQQGPATLCCRLRYRDDVVGSWSGNSDSPVRCQ